MLNGSGCTESHSHRRPEMIIGPIVNSILIGHHRHTRRSSSRGQTFGANMHSLIVVSVVQQRDSQQCTLRPCPRAGNDHCRLVGWFVCITCSAGISRADFLGLRQDRAIDPAWICFKKMFRTRILQKMKAGNFFDNYFGNSDNMLKIWSRFRNWAWLLIKELILLSENGHFLKQKVIELF